ncbi:MAG TPA: trypsin-like peptidase domain-containing protein [Longimicrobiales bacterium]|nr:trypsin-like peptidase domain-containing protein [Longimicrobiales bacterium]
MSARRLLPVLAALLSALAAGCTEPIPGAEPGAEPASLALQDPATADPELRERQQEALESSRRTAIVRAAERVAPAVVSVNVIRRETVQPRTIYEQFFLPPGAERRVAGFGSGFIIHEDGLVLTNEHVVRGATEVVVTLADGRDFDAEVVGTDEVNDLALLRLVAGGEKLPAAPIGTSDDLLIGEWVVAIGNPFGYLLSNTEPTVTAGVVSGVGRNIIPTGEETRGYYLGMIQTDASINPGNSGGPLVNAEGQVIGVNSSIFSRSGGSEGLGFAIPIDRARNVVLDLIDDGVVRRPWTGVELEPANPNRFGRSRLVRVAGVAPGSPAEAAGLRVGELVHSAGGHPIRTTLDWEAALLEVRVGEPLRIAVGEDGGRVVTLTPRDLPSLTAERVSAIEEFELVTLTPAIRSERGLTRERGALIVGLSDAARRTLGLREGDLIIGVNRYAVASAEEAASLLTRLQQVSGRVAVRLLVERAGREFYTSFYL